MAEMIMTNAGEIVILTRIQDFMSLIETYISFEARRWLEEYLHETYGEEEGELESLTDYYEERIKEKKELLKEIRKESETLAGLICEKELDRKAISNTAGRIGCLTWKGVNAP